MNTHGYFFMKLKTAYVDWKLYKMLRTLESE